MRTCPHSAAIWLLVVLGGIGCAGTARAQGSLPQLTAPVNDFANVIDAGERARARPRIRALEADAATSSSWQPCETFEPYARHRRYAVKLFENGGRGIGDKGKDNGLLIVVAVEDAGADRGRLRPRAVHHRRLRRRDDPRRHHPQFRNGNYGEGLLAGVTTIINRIAERRGVTLQDVPAPPPPARSTGSGFPLVDHHRPDHHRDH